MRGVVDREQVTVEEEMLMLHSENWHEKHEYAPFRGPIDGKENKKRMKRFQIVQHNSYINSRQEIAKRKCQSHWKSLASLNRFGPFQATSELQQENRTGSWDRV